MTQTTEDAEILAVRGACKRFGDVNARDGASFTVSRPAPRISVGVLLLIGWLGWPGEAAAQSPIRGLSADQFNVSLTLLQDGSLDVRETMVFRFRERRLSELEREISLTGLDDVIDVRAAMDGQPLEEGRGEAQVRVRRGRRTLRVIWRFPETIDRTRMFTLEYRVMGVLALAHGRATLAWPVLPRRYRYPIDHASVEWRVPASAVRVEPTRLDDARWTSAAMSDGWTATREGLSPGDAVTLTDAFDETTLAVAVPTWQTNMDYAQQMAPAFVIGAATLIVMGAGVVGMTWFRYHRPRVDLAVVMPAAANSLPPAVGTALFRGWVAVGIPQMRAALLDLVRRGIVTIRETGSGESSTRAYQIVMPPPQGLRVHEQVIADALWPHLKHGEIDLRAGWKHLQRALPAFRRGVLDELRESGLLDTERHAAAKGLRNAGVVVVVLGVAGVAIFLAAFEHLGDVPLLVPGAVLACGVMFLIAGQMMSVLSFDGATAAAAWRARRRELKRTFRRPMDAGEMERWLPAAAGLGLADAMTKGRAGGPAWLAQLADRAR